MDYISPNLSMPLIAPSQAQKHVTHNEALRLLDIFVHLTVESTSETSPPASPSIGTRYIVASGGLLEWAGHDGEIAVFEETGWAFVSAPKGAVAYAVDSGKLIVREDSGWIALPAKLTSADLSNLPGIGINTTPDATNAIAAAAEATLLSHAGAGHQLKINKNSGGDTASLLFQSNYTGHAEMGLSGETDFTIKVSGDGSSWFTALRSDGSSGRVTFPGGGVREVLASARTWYVDPLSGNDGNDGLSPANGAFATLQRAIDAAVSVDAGGHALTIRLSDGIHDLPQPIRIARSVVGIGKLDIIGNETNPENVILDGSNGVFECSAGVVNVSGISIQSASGDGFFVKHGSTLIISKLIFGSTGGEHIKLYGGACDIIGDYTINGNASAHISMDLGSRLELQGKTVTLTGTPDFMNAYMICAGGSNARIVGNTFTGAATGQRYYVAQNATINTGAAGTLHLPGSSAGNAVTGGIYD